MSEKDVRWVQRFDHFKKALLQLKKAVDLSRTRPLSDLEQQGLIQAFEYTHELAWNTLKDFLDNIGSTKLYGSKDTTREAFTRGLLEDGETWMDMIKKRNLTSHTYNQETAQEIVNAAIKSYEPQFQKLCAHLEKIASES